ncbi:MAG: VPLPA-CTERM sorting domain-containing protein [Pseudomonadota bacterium]
MKKPFLLAVLYASLSTTIVDVHASTIQLKYQGFVSSASGTANPNAVTVSGVISVSNSVIDGDARSTVDDFRSDSSSNTGSQFSATFNAFDFDGNLIFSDRLDPVADTLGQLRLVNGFANGSDFFEQLVSVTQSGPQGNALNLNLFENSPNDNFLAGNALSGNLLSGIPAILLSSNTSQNNSFGLRSGTIFEGRYTFRLSSISQVPLPAAAWLFLSAIGGLFGLKRYQSSQAV